MKKYAWIDNGKVVTVTEAQDDFVPPANWLELADQDVATGDSYDGVTFTKPAVDVDAIRKQLWGEARSRLRRCDWTQVADGTVGQARADWAQYRNALRALLGNPALPIDTALPDPPYSFDEA